MVGLRQEETKQMILPVLFFFYIWHLSRFCFALQKVMNLKSEDVPQIPAELLQPPKGVPNQVLVEEKTA